VIHQSLKRRNFLHTHDGRFVQCVSPIYVLNLIFEPVAHLAQTLVLDKITKSSARVGYDLFGQSKLLPKGDLQVQSKYLGLIPSRELLENYCKRTERLNYR